MGDNLITRDCTIPQTHKYLKTKEDSSLGTLKIYKHHGKEELVMMKEKTLNSQGQVTLEIAATERRFGLKHPNLVEMVDWGVTVTSQLCATFYRLQSCYNYTPRNLARLIHAKKKQNQYLDDTKIIQLAYDGIDGLSYLQNNNFNHGYLRPDLFMMEPKGRFVVVDRLVEGTGMDSHLFAYRSKMKQYCSPAVWSEMVTERKNPHDKFKDDAFSFGCIMLAAANLASPQDIYQPDGTINDQALSKNIQMASNRYEHIPLFGQMLEGLLQVDESKRLDFVSLFDSMPSRVEIQNFFEHQDDGQVFDHQHSVMDSIHGGASFNQGNSGVMSRQMETSMRAGPPLASQPSNTQKYYPNPGNLNYAQTTPSNRVTQRSQVLSKSHNQTLESQEPAQRAADLIAYDFDGERNKNIVHKNQAIEMGFTRGQETSYRQQQLGFGGGGNVPLQQSVQQVRQEQPAYRTQQQQPPLQQQQQQLPMFGNQLRDESVRDTFRPQAAQQPPRQQFQQPPAGQGFQGRFGATSGVQSPNQSFQPVRHDDSFHKRSSSPSHQPQQQPAPVVISSRNSFGFNKPINRQQPSFGNSQTTPIQGFQPQALSRQQASFGFGQNPAPFTQKQPLQQSQKMSYKTGGQNGPTYVPLKQYQQIISPQLFKRPVNLKKATTSILTRMLGRSIRLD